jgi:uncharacterized membrane protein YraQ (UPF0718 family)
MNIFQVFNDIFLKMTWLESLMFELLQLFGLSESSTLFGILHFFLYDTIKIFLLLSFLIFALSYIQSYLPPERTTKILQKYKGIKGNIIGALLGTLTPFCSCSSIPVFIGFTKAGLPLGITFSFLISSPLVDLASFLILMSFLGWEIALAYVVVGIILAVIGGTIIDHAKMEEYLQDYVIKLRDEAIHNEQVILSLSKRDRVDYALEQVLDIIKRVWIYIFIGVSIGAVIHNVIPREFIETVLGDKNPFSVVLATLVGIPMYADIFGTIPIAEALLSKGVGVGTILAFMMSVTALSLPSMVMLSKVVKTRLLVTFISIVTVGILIIGYLFNILQISI